MARNPPGNVIEFRVGDFFYRDCRRGSIGFGVKSVKLSHRVILQ
jgi:hypothetical protein